MQSACVDKAGTLVIVSLTTVVTQEKKTGNVRSSLPLATTHPLSAAVTKTVVESPGTRIALCDACRGIASFQGLLWLQFMITCSEQNGEGIRSPVHGRPSRFFVELCLLCVYLLLCHTTACEKASQAMQDDSPSTFAHWTNTGGSRGLGTRLHTTRHICSPPPPFPPSLTPSYTPPSLTPSYAPSPPLLSHKKE